MATFDYTSRDYLSIRQDLVDRAAEVLPEWNGNDASDFANVFVDLWAYMGDVLHYYIDRAAAETFLETATQRESVIAIANLLDYIPGSARSARGTVTLQLTQFPTGQTSYVVPQFTTLTGYDADGNSYDFYLTTNSPTMTVIGEGGQVTVSVIQGSITSNEAIGASTGLANQRFRLLKTNVDIDSIEILVYEGPVDISGNPTPVTYQYVSQLSSASYQDKVFTARITSDNYTEIIFGNGFNGTIPETNATVEADYRTTAGSSGNLPASSIKSISSPASNFVIVASSSATSGGADTESIDSIKNNVSRLYRTQDRAVSLQDFKDLTLQIPGISKATAQFTPQSAPAFDLVTLYPVPHQTVYPPAPTSGQVLIDIPTNIVESVENYFETRSMVGVTASVINPVDVETLTRYVVCTPVYVRIKLYVKDNYVQTWVRNEVEQVVRALLDFDNVTFGQKITIGEIYRAILSVTGVDYAELRNLNTTYYGGGTGGDGTSGTVVNVQIDPYKLPCFSDEIGGFSAITFAPIVGGLTGSN